eukprot:3680-Heterococcus_DN1.PRE.1
MRLRSGMHQCTQLLLLLVPPQIATNIHYSSQNASSDAMLVAQRVTAAVVAQVIPGVPHCVCNPGCSAATFAKPKSAIFIAASSSLLISSKFSGFKSLHSIQHYNDSKASDTGQQSIVIVYNSVNAASCTVQVQYKAGPARQQ